MIIDYYFVDLCIQTLKKHKMNLKFLTGKEEKEVLIRFHTKEQQRYRRQLDSAKNKLKTISLDDYRSVIDCMRVIRYSRSELRKQTAILNKLNNQ